MNKNESTLQEYDQLLKKHIDKRSFVKIEREFLDCDASLSGYLLDVSDGFLMVQKEEEFFLDGYAIIPKFCFDGIRHNKFDKTLGKIMRKEGIEQEHYGIDYDVDLTDWPSIFKSLRNRDLHVILECEDLEDPVFLIGPITRVGKKSVSIHYYDSTGKQDEKPTKVRYEDITILRFDERYINIFRKYIRKRK